MDHSSSSSSSSMSSVSMDDSERSGFGYLGEDEEPEEEEEEEDAPEYDDIPEEDDDDEDDMDDDDDEEDDDDAIFIADNTHPNLLRHHAIPFFRSFAARANGLHLEHLLSDSPIVGFPPNAAASLSPHDRGRLRAVFMDSWENLPRFDIDRLATQLGDSVRLHSDSLAQLTSRLRGGLSAMLEPRMILSTDAARATPSSVHPLLLRPPIVSPPDPQNDNVQSILSALRHDPSFTGRVRIAGRPHHPPNPPSNPLRNLANAVSSVQRTYNSNQGGRDAVAQPTSSAAPSGEPSSSVAGGSASDVPAPTDYFAEARNLNQQTLAIVDSLNAASLEHSQRAGADGGSDREALEVLAEYDLTRSVDPAAASNPSDLLSGFSSRNRSPFERMANRDREREKVPSGILKRWSYGPPSCGGDSLPAIFDTELSYRAGRHGGRANRSTSSMPVIAPQTHEAVNELSTKVINRIDGLMTDLAKIDAKVATLEAKEEMRKEVEEKNKKKKRKKPDEQSEGKDAAGASGERIENEEANENPNIEAPVDPSISEAVAAIGEGSTEEAVPDFAAVPTSASEPRTGTSTADQGAEEERPDAVMNAVDEEQEGAQEERRHLETGGAPAAAADIQQNAAPVPGNENQTPRNDFAAVAAQRAAAAGISLDAPANENPDVVRAATQSTGIDPAFIAALPEDMRAEILTQYYEQIHTNNDGQAGAGSSPSATTVNQDFLVALPPALRAEVLELEAEFQSRHQNANNAGDSGGNNAGPNGSGGGSAAVGEEMDNATFLATLDSGLREEILLTSGEAFIQSLPPSVAAEARVLREREANSRMPWRVNPQLHIGFDGRRLTNRIRELANAGRTGSRSKPKVPPAYRWKKIERGWLREGPKTEDEPDHVLELEGLSALLRLLWLQQGHYGKTYLYQVLSHACKSTKSRFLVLEQLIKLITSSSSGSRQSQASSSKSIPEFDCSQHHGTAVRRALELLILLCKNDAVVSETLLGLPRTEEEASKIPEEITEHTVLPRRKSDISLSTLVSLLDTTLFIRSNSHLEQLVSLINTLCLALPPTLFDGSDRRNDNSIATRRRRMVERAGFNPELGDPMNFLLDPDEEPQPIFQVTVDDDDDSIDDDFENLVGSSSDRDSRPRSSRRETRTGEKESSTEKNLAIPPQYRIPGFESDDLVALTKVLLRQSCSERTYERVSRSIGILGELVPIRMVFVDSLVKMAISSGQEVQKEYQEVIADLESSMKSKSTNQKKSIISTFSLASAGSELMLLRVVKSLSTLWVHEAVENAPKKSEGSTKVEKVSEISAVRKPSTPQISTERRFRPSMCHGLLDLWNAMDKLLELVSDEAGLKKTQDPTETRRAVSAANLNRMRAPNRSLSPILARLSPMIESFLVTHSADESDSEKQEQASPKIAKVANLSSLNGSPKCPPNGKLMDSDEMHTSPGMEGELSVFVEKHRGPINALLRANPPLLESSFKGALKHPHAIDFDNKKAYFRNVIRKRSSEVHTGSIRISVRRDRVFDDSYQQLRLRTPDEMKGRLHVQFNGEEGVDAGGVTREWYIILARQIFDPNYVLFTRSAAKAATYQPDKRSLINREHLDTFKFVGRIIGKAIYDGQLVDAYFTRSFYKHILGLKPTYHDIEAEDPDYYKSLKWILENDITGILDYTMSAEYDEFGKQTVIDLVPNGRDIPVTEGNKAEYVRLVTEVRMTKTIEQQIESFKDGFHELIPHDDCKIFNELELELLMSGLPDIDMADLKANVEYTGYTASSPQINWFWRVVSKMNQEDLARLVMFVTGTSKVPLEGFSKLQGMNGLQKFQIHKVSGNTMRLPSAHTCFNQLDLPEYSSAEILSERLLRAVRECSVGFGFA